MQISNSEMKKILGIVKVGIPKPAESIQPNTVIFGKKAIMVIANNTSVCVAYDTGISCAVPAKALMAFVDKCSGDNDFTFELSDGTLNAKCGKAKAKIVTEAVNDATMAMAREALISDAWASVPFNWNKFSVEVANVAHATSRDETRQVLMSVHIGNDKEGLFAEATDGRRAIRRYFSDEQEDINFNLPKSCLKMLSETEMTEYAISNGWLIFRNGTITYAMRLNEGSFPNVIQVRPALDASKNVALDQEVYEVIARFAAFGIEVVNLKFTKEEVTLTGSSDTMTFTETVSAQSSRKFSVAFNAQYLREMLQFGREAQMDNDTPAYMEDGKGWYVLMPLKNLVNDDDEPTVEEVE